MQINKQLIAIIILASLLLSALGAAFYFYKKDKLAIIKKVRVANSNLFL
ncbi:MAG: hypothetical protein R2837_11900 [Aliarcobacter sp.]